MYFNYGTVVLEFSDLQPITWWLFPRTLVSVNFLATFVVFSTLTNIHPTGPWSTTGVCVIRVLLKKNIPPTTTIKGLLWDYNPEIPA